MKKVIIIGAGGLGREILQIIKDINNVEPRFEIMGFLNDDGLALDGYDNDHEILGPIDAFSEYEDVDFIFGIANPQIKKRIISKMKAEGCVFLSVIHPSAIIAHNAEIGEGFIAYPYSYVGPDARIDPFVTLLTFSSIGHDVQVGAYTTTSSYCDITGFVKIGERCFLGSHTTIVPHSIIGDEVFIGAGSVVTTDISDKIRVFGNPARRIIAPK